MYKLLETQIQPKKLGTKNLEAKFLIKFEEPNLPTKFMNMHEQVFETKFEKKVNTKFEAQELEKKK